MFYFGETRARCWWHNQSWIFVMSSCCLSVLSFWYCFVLHVERQHTKQKLSAEASRLNSVNIVLHCIMCVVTLIAGGEGRTMSEYNKLLPSLSSVHVPVLQPITLMLMVRASFDALISLHAVPMPWRLPAVHRNACCVCAAYRSLKSYPFQFFSSLHVQ